jgi:branched-chain amino acid aminotransferase
MHAVRGLGGQWNILFPEEHLDRLIMTAAAIGVAAPEDLDRNLLRRGLVQTAECNRRFLPAGMPLYLRPIIGEASVELGVSSKLGYFYVVISRNKTPYLGSEAEAGVTVWSLGTKFCRTTPECGLAGVKSASNYPLGYKYKYQAGQLGAKEVLQWGLDGTLKETTGSNVFVVVDRVIMTPALDGSVLPGINRQRIIELGRALEYEVRETNLTREHLLSAEEMFLTGTWAGVVPVRTILEGVENPQPLNTQFNGKDPGSVTLALKQVYSALLQHDLAKLPGEFAVREDWWLPVS